MDRTSPFPANSRDSIENRPIGWSLPSSHHLALPPVACHTARSRSDYEGAFELLQRRYQESGLSPWNGRGMRIMPYQLDSNSQVFVAESEKMIVGTVTLVSAPVSRLPIFDSHPEVAPRLKRKEGRIGEITCLAIDPARDLRCAIFGKLTQLLTYFARSQGLEFLTAVVHPRHAKFYRRAMGFNLCGDEKRCRIVGGNPGVAMISNINDASGCRPPWRSYYFDGAFSEEDLQARPMCQIDRFYFSKIMPHGFQYAVERNSQRKAA